MIKTNPECIKDSAGVNWTLRKLGRFDKAIELNLSSGAATFAFEGRQYQTAHSFYLAKYLRVELEQTTKKTNEIKG